VYDSATGKLTLVDLASGKSTSANYHSGGFFGSSIPPGTYHILEHGRKDEFRLEPKDATFGDDYDDQSGRGIFRLHGPGGTSGCITARTDEDWAPVRDFLRRTPVTDSTVDTYKALGLPYGLQPSWLRYKTGTETVRNYGTLVVK
jgi:hypothetical protein